MTLTEKQRIDLGEIVEKWLLKQDLLSDEHDYELILKTKPREPKVTVQLENAQSGNQGDLVDIFKKLSPNMKARVMNVLNNAEISTLQALLDKEAHQLSKHRNVGNKVIRELFTILNDLGHTDSVFVTTARSFVGEDGGSVAYQTKLAVVRPLEPSDWELLKSTVVTPPVSNSELYKEMLIALEKANNMGSAEKLFPNSVKPSYRGNFIAAMNTRFANRKLPYRIKFTHDPSYEGRKNNNGTVQIGIYRYE
jgi:hypothetical protein